MSTSSSTPANQRSTAPTPNSPQAPLPSTSSTSSITPTTPAPPSAPISISQTAFPLPPPSSGGFSTPPKSSRDGNSESDFPAGSTTSASSSTSCPGTPPQRGGEGKSPLGVELEDSQDDAPGEILALLKENQDVLLELDESTDLPKLVEIILVVGQFKQEEYKRLMSEWPQTKGRPVTMEHFGRLFLSGDPREHYHGMFPIFHENLEQYIQHIYLPGFSPLMMYHYVSYMVPEITG